MENASTSGKGWSEQGGSGELAGKKAGPRRPKENSRISQTQVQLSLLCSQPAQVGGAQPT